MNALQGWANSLDKQVNALQGWANSLDMGECDLGMGDLFRYG